jgi:hypothetical protein
MSEFSRISGVFFEPGKTFEDIGRRPSWFVPMLLMIVAGLAYYLAYGQHVGWERFLQRQMEISPKAAERMAQVPAEKRDSTIALQAKVTGISYYVGTVIGTPLIMVISSAILLGITAMMSAGLKFKQIFAITAYAGLPVILKHALSLVVMFLKKPDDFNLMNPLAFNPGAFMDPVSSSKFTYTIASALDLFAIWGIILTAIGLKAAAGKRLSMAGALTAVIIPWAVFVLFGASMASIFS